MRIIFVCICFFGSLQADSAMAPTVCLNMIVKDEASVIRRCLQSVKPFIDYWVIVDTGSSDGTQEIIREFMEDVPGELHERSWVNFGVNRNQALQLAKGKSDYLLFIDADEALEGAFDKKALSKDYYLVKLRLMRQPLTTSLRALLIRAKLPWHWRGVLHETLNLELDRSFETLPDAIVSAEAHDGRRARDPEKFLKDAQVLEKALRDDPNNSVYVFYLAQSYQAANKDELALKNYQRRVQMRGWEQHTFWSQYCIAKFQESMGSPPEEFLKSYNDAFLLRQTRAEPVGRLANYFYQEKQYLLGYLLARFGLTLPMPDDIVYVEEWIYSHGMLALFANCALELGRYEEAFQAYERIEKQGDVPEEMRQQARNTMRFIEKKRAKEL